MEFLPYKQSKVSTFKDLWRQGLPCEETCLAEIGDRYYMTKVEKLDILDLGPQIRASLMWSMQCECSQTAFDLYRGEGVFPFG